MVLMFSYYSCGENELVKLISFAGTVASIILSIIAIFMTILSNDSIAGMLNNVRNVSDSIKDVPSSINESVKEIQIVTTLLRESFDGMKSTICSLEERVVHVDGEVSLTNAKIDELKEVALIQGNTPVKNSNSSKSKIDYHEVIKRASYYGLILMYSICLACREGLNSLSLKSLANIVRCSEDYLLAYAVALSTTGIVSLTSNSSILSGLACAEYVKEDDILNILKRKALEIAEANAVENTLDKEISDINEMIMNAKGSNVG